MRDEDWVKTLNQCSVETLRARLQKLEADLPRLEDRCEDEDWTQAAIAMTNHLFWLDENEAWHWFVPRFIESLAYSSELRDGLIKTADSWKKSLSKSWQKRLKLFRIAADIFADPKEEAAMLTEVAGRIFRRCRMEARMGARICTSVD